MLRKYNNRTVSLRRENHNVGFRERKIWTVTTFETSFSWNWKHESNFENPGGSKRNYYLTYSQKEDCSEDTERRKMSPLSLTSLLVFFFPSPNHHYWSLSFFLSFITEVIKPCEWAPPCLITSTVNKRRLGGEGVRRTKREERRREERQMKKHSWQCAVLL